MKCPNCGCDQETRVIPETQRGSHGEIRYEPDAASREYDAALARVEADGPLRARQIAELDRLLKL